MDPLNIVMTPVGSSGDVHPFIGLGAALARRGHEVRVLAGSPFRAAIEGNGLTFVSTWTEEEYEELTHDPNLWHPRRGMKVIMGAVRDGLRDHYRLIEANLASDRPSLIVGHSIALAARFCEEKTGTPAITVHLAPTAFRSDFDQPSLLPGRDFSGWPRVLKRLLWAAADRFAIEPLMQPWLSDFAAELGLGPVRFPFRGWLHSPNAVVALFPDWFGPPQPDWPRNLKLAGFPLYDEADQRGGLDDELRAFLDAGDAPLVFTPGSANRQASRFFRAAADASVRLGRRALFLSRYQEHLPPALPDGVLHRPYVPLSAILPRAAALIHHGGIGTLAQGLAAGVPQLVMPMAFDQPDNTTRLMKLGVGTFVAPKGFTGERVAARLGPLLGAPDVAARCRDLAGRIAAADPLRSACDAIEAAASPRGAAFTS